MFVLYCFNVEVGFIILWNECILWNNKNKKHKQNAINFLFIFLLTIQLRGSNAYLPIASTLVENVNNLGNYVLSNSWILHPKNPCKSLGIIVFFFPFRLFGSKIFVLELYFYFLLFDFYFFIKLKEFQRMN